jgi:hypothetical protein
VELLSQFAESVEFEPLTIFTAVLFKTLAEKTPELEEEVGATPKLLHVEAPAAEYCVVVEQAPQTAAVVPPGEAVPAVHIVQVLAPEEKEYPAEQPVQAVADALEQAEQPVEQAAQLVCCVVEVKVPEGQFWQAPTLVTADE